ncbi:hypothetical protein DFH09DRAFT_1098360 [Mycena vulgaris]|nr:hypothetical protein DFH09DRAFT_1098360 [Mycena vulgaris]
MDEVDVGTARERKESTDNKHNEKQGSAENKNRTKAGPISDAPYVRPARAARTPRALLGRSVRIRVWGRVAVCSSVAAARRGLASRSSRAKIKPSLASRSQAALSGSALAGAGFTVGSAAAWDSNTRGADNSGDRHRSALIFGAGQRNSTGFHWRTMARPYLTDFRRKPLDFGGSTLAKLSLLLGVFHQFSLDIVDADVEAPMIVTCLFLPPRGNICQRIEQISSEHL